MSVHYLLHTFLFLFIKKRRKLNNTIATLEKIKENIHILLWFFMILVSLCSYIVHFYMTVIIDYSQCFSMLSHILKNTSYQKIT